MSGKIELEEEEKVEELFCKALEKNNLSTIQELLPKLENKNTIKIPGIIGATYPLIHAIQHSHFATIKTLVESNLDLTIINKNNQDPLFFAAQRFDSTIVSYLLEYLPLNIQCLKKAIEQVKYKQVDEVVEFVKIILRNYKKNSVKEYLKNILDDESKRIKEIREQKKSPHTLCSKYGLNKLTEEEKIAAKKIAVMHRLCPYIFNELDKTTYKDITFKYTYKYTI